MNRSDERILTTHTGSLHMPPELKDQVLADWRQELDPADYSRALRNGVGEVVARQIELGIDVVNDGEFSKPTWCTYVVDRMSGIDLRPADSAEMKAADEFNVTETEPGSKEWTDFADFYRDAFSQVFYHEPGAGQELLALVEQITPVVTGKIRYAGDEVIARDVENLRAATAGAKVSDIFMPAVAPGSIQPLLVNEYYDDDESLFADLAAALNAEYHAIVDAGMLLQIDDAYLTSEWDAHLLEEGWTLERYRAWAELSVESLNAALEGIPEDRVRYHVCWGSWNGPHSTDIPLREIVDLVLKVKAQAYSLEAANARHAYEYKVWEDVALPDGKILLPGVIEHATNVVEHPETVADRIVRFANVVGRENVIASTDCGLRDRIHPQVAWAKLAALSEGAALASKTLWGS